MSIPKSTNWIKSLISTLGDPKKDHLLNNPFFLSVPYYIFGIQMFHISQSSRLNPIQSTFLLVVLTSL